MPRVQCSLCGNAVEPRQMVAAQKLDNHTVGLIKKDRPEWEGKRGVCQSCLEQYRAKKFLGYRGADDLRPAGGRQGRPLRSSWTFIFIFAGILFVWMGINAWVLTAKPFDPYPFILLNLVLSTLAALQAPVIMMSQNRQAEKDRMEAKQDYEINLMAELEIRDLHDKMDVPRYKQWHELWHMQQRQLELLEHLHKELSHPEQVTREPEPFKLPEL